MPKTTATAKAGRKKSLPRKTTSTTTLSTPAGAAVAPAVLPPTERRIEDLSAFFHHVVTEYGPERRLWFRGCGRTSYVLLPGLYRHPTAHDFATFQDLERRIFATFRDRSIPFTGQPPASGDGAAWHHFFVMQHYRVPTRLLDWSESPFVALYFALNAALQGVAVGQQPAEDAAVWILDPVSWNAHSLRNVATRPAVPDVLTKESPILKSYSPDAPGPGSPYPEPLAIYGMHNSARIVAQRGAFTLFGSDMEPMERLFTVNVYPRESLSKIVIPREHCATMLSSLVRIGYTDSVIFPDLEGLAQEIRREMGFNV